jgi:hypothetical protein
LIGTDPRLRRLADAHRMAIGRKAKPATVPRILFVMHT